MILSATDIKLFTQTFFNLTYKFITLHSLESSTKPLSQEKVMLINGKRFLNLYILPYLVFDRKSTKKI